MANVTKTKPRKLNITIRPTPADARIVSALRTKLGVDTSQIFRLAIRALAVKEGLAA